MSPGHAPRANRVLVDFGNGGAKAVRKLLKGAEGVLATAALAIALCRIGSFDLTDINRF